MRISLCLGLKAVLAAAIFSQSVCDRAAADLPSIHGLRLGISRREAAMQYEMTPAILVSRNSENYFGLRHVESVWFDFSRDAMSAFEIDYDRSTEWKNVRQFAEQLNRELNLAAASWVFVGETEAEMRCADFKIWLSSVRNTLTVTDTSTKTAAGKSGKTRVGFYDGLK